MSDPTAEPLQLVIASANRHKAAEIRAIVDDWLRATTDPLPIELLDRPAGVPDVEETGSTLEENARLKARALASATGIVALADDTGLEVAALGGAPGVRSARYAGPEAIAADNVAKLLAAMDALEQCGERAARFRTVMLVAFPDGRELSSEGVVEGSIALEPRGDAGFGYDPLFVPEGCGGATFAELAPSEKDAVSHRGRALRALLDELLARRAGLERLPRSRERGPDAAPGLAC